jgi:F-type H+-transporting ATPase subunit alpha
MSESENINSKTIPTLEVKEIGYVNEVKRGIAKVSGLPSCIYGQLVEFQSHLKGIVIGFDTKETAVIILGEERLVKVGDRASTYSDLFKVPIGEKFIGRIVNGMAEPIDEKGDIDAAEYRAVFSEAPMVMEREPITKPLLTGIKMLDLTIPIGKGQRELIVGDRHIGKTAIALDAILNQKDKDVICIYCWIGGSYTAFEAFLRELASLDVLKYMIAVCAPAASPAAEQYLAPYTAACLGEYFMNKGKDVLVVFDDLTKHAWIYRQMSLLLERAPGREAYPGDIFFLHSQLMERAGKLKKDLGGGSMTFLPIVETLQGDITGYIQSNLVSMTDGQIYLNSNLFHEGIKPAIDLGLSVSRIGSKVQCEAIKEISGFLRLEYTQYRETIRLTRLRTRLSEDARARIKRGETLQELLLQENMQPVSLEEEIIIFYAFKRKILEVLAPHVLKQFKGGIMAYIKQQEPKLLEDIRQKQELTDEIKKRLDAVFLKYFKKIKQVG